MCTTSPTIKDGSSHEMEFQLSVEDPNSFFQYQRKNCLSQAQIGCNTNLNFVSKTGDVVSVHQAAILPYSSHLKLLVDSIQSCGCTEDVPTLVLPDWDFKIIQDLVHLLYSGSVFVTDNSMEELLMLMRELRFDISRDQFLAEPVVHLTDIFKDYSTSDKSLVGKASVGEKQLFTNSTTSEIFLNDNSYQEKISWIPRIKIENTETKRRNDEQERLRKKLSEVVDFLERVQIKNEETLAVLIKPLDDLVSSLKYLPTEPSFDFLPTEIKTNIFSYLCNSGAFVSASVCREWKEILQKRLRRKEIKIGKHCSNVQECENGKCFMPEEILMASITVKLDVCLRICYPVTNVDSKLLAEGLTSVPELRIIKECICGEYAQKQGPGWTPYRKEMLTQTQIQEFITILEQKNEVLKAVELSGLYLEYLDYEDQDRLMNCLLKVDRVLLGYGSSYESPQLDEDMLIDKLLQNAPNFNVTQLYLEQMVSRDEHFYPYNHTDEDFADALCQIETIYLGQRFQMSEMTIYPVIYNVLNLTIRMENLFIFQELKWYDLIGPEDLKVFMANLKKFALCGDFTEEQVDAAKSIPGVDIIPYNYQSRNPDAIRPPQKMIKKEIEIDTSLITSFDLTELFFNK